MSSRPVIALVAFSILSLSAPTGFAADKKKYPKNLFAATAIHYDVTHQPKGLDWYATSPEGKAFLGAVATAMGVAPIYVSIAKVAIPDAVVAGQEKTFTLPVPQGYAYCASKISVLSIVPTEDRRSPTMNGKAKPMGVEFKTWVDTPGFGKERNWIEGDAVVWGIKPQYLKEFEKKGVCQTPSANGDGFISCRGRSACTTPGVHGKPDLAGKSTPTLKKKA